MNERQIEIVAQLVVGALMEAAPNPTNAVDGKVSVRVSSAQISDRAAQYGEVGIWSIRHAMGHVAKALSRNIGVPREAVSWDCDERPALDKGYVFTAPLSALAPPPMRAVTPGADGMRVTVSMASEIKQALAQAAAANRKTAKLAEALAALCSAAEPAPGIPDAFILRRSDVLSALEILSDKTDTATA